jgi:hypothetical protein
VGLATVAGIQAFEQGQNRANQDALTQSAVKIASDVQANLKEPTQFGGAGAGSASDVESGDVPNLSDLGYNSESSGGFSHTGSTVYNTSAGECSLSSSSGLPATVKCASEQAKVTVEISSLDPGGITTTSQEIKS